MGKLDGSPHLVCIGALKKLCNHPSLLLHKAREADECPDNIEQVVTWIDGSRKRASPMSLFCNFAASSALT